MDKVKKNLLCLPKGFSLYTGGMDVAKNWYLEFFEDGKRKRVKEGINRLKTVDERIEFVQLLVKDIVGASLPDAPKDFVLLIDSFIIDCVESTNQKTINDYKTKLTHIFGCCKELNEPAIKSFFSQEIKAKSSKTYNAYLNLVKRFLQWQNIEVDLSKLKRRKTHSEGAMYFTAAQMKRLKAVISVEKPNLWLLIELMYYCFLRPRKEIRLLKWSAIDWDNKTIFLPSNQSKRGFRRIAKVPGSLYESLLPYKNEPSENYIIALNGVSGEKPIGNNTAWTWFNNYLKKLRITGQKYTLYSVRNTAAYDTIMNGVSIEVLSKRMGHHDITQTQEYIRNMGLDDFEKINDFYPQI